MSAAAAAAAAVSICMHKQGRDDVVSSLTPGHVSTWFLQIICFWNLFLFFLKLFTWVKMLCSYGWKAQEKNPYSWGVVQSEVQFLREHKLQ